MQSSFTTPPAACCECVVFICLTVFVIVGFSPSLPQSNLQITPARKVSWIYATYLSGKEPKDGARKEEAKLFVLWTGTIRIGFALLIWSACSSIRWIG